MLKNLVVFTSGKGSTLKFLLDAEAQGLLSGRVCLVVSDKSGSGGAVLAAEYGVPVVCSTDEDFILKRLQQEKADFILLAGYLRKISDGILRAYRGRIFNTHPSLLPKYGGKGMYGSHVHQAVFAAQEKESGITIHEVNENYDDGKILAQKRITIEDCRSSAEVESRLKSLEKDFLLEWLNQKLSQ